MQFKVVTTIASLYHHTSPEVTITIIPTRMTLPNMQPFLDSSPTTQLFMVDFRDPQLSFSFFISEGKDESNSLSSLKISSEQLGTLSYNYVDGVL